MVKEARIVQVKISYPEYMMRKIYNLLLMLSVNTMLMVLNVFNAREIGIRIWTIPLFLWVIVYTLMWMNTKQTVEIISA